MTNIRKSDAQLDAEAAVRGMIDRACHHKYECSCHKPPLEKWRIAFARELPTKLTSSYPPEMTEMVDGVRTRIIDPGTRVGFTMSNGLEQYLVSSGGHNFPVHDALLLWDRECRRRHASWPDHRGRAVCAELAWYVIRDRTSLAWAAEMTGVSWPRAERLLLYAISWMRKRQERWLADTTMSAGHDPEYCAECRRMAG